MRICHVIESTAAGSAAVLISLSTHAVRRGHDVHIVYSPDRADGAVVQQFKSLGASSVTSTAMRRAVTPHDLIDGFNLRRAISRMGPLDVIHSHSSKAGALARTACLGLAKAQIYSPHGFFTMGGKAPFYVAPVERLLSRVTDKIIAVSQAEADHAADIQIAPSKVAVVTNGIDPFDPLPRHRARAKLGLGKDDFVIGFVGRLSKQKAPEQAIAVLDSLPADDRFMLVIVGDGELGDFARRRAAESGRRIVFAGARPARPLYSAFDCLLCTSRYEGMPVTFLEALNCGIPIVTYPVGGAKELVGETGAGFIVEAMAESAASAISEAVRQLPGEREALVKRCFAAARHHSAARMSDETLALYRSIVGA